MGGVGQVVEQDGTRRHLGDVPNDDKAMYAQPHATEPQQTPTVQEAAKYDISK